MSAHTPPSSYLKRPLTALLSLSLLLPLSGCFIEETKSDSEARAAEVCEGARQEVSLECVCDPLTALLSCPAPALPAPFERRPDGRRCS